MSAFGTSASSGALAGRASYGRQIPFCIFGASTICTSRAERDTVSFGRSAAVSWGVGRASGQTANTNTNKRSISPLSSGWTDRYDTAWILYPTPYPAYTELVCHPEVSRGCLRPTSLNTNVTPGENLLRLMLPVCPLVPDPQPGFRPIHEPHGGNACSVDRPRSSIAGDPSLAKDVYAVGCHSAALVARHRTPPSPSDVYLEPRTRVRTAFLPCAHRPCYVLCRTSCGDAP
ncbi:uncharacterized protein B0H18DRAFT_649491 [Fomitopsis serialis]|uniref:uncharacterized protein n=1 Tax=Fomitopsis serialis TaxID=139415 RepID=UPI0020075274|nr:uncharacterized protein B0H18DRAFT_649491 [Neoantrodia serialis]KAH9919227.1 hypothetical protein B0H18DRAFT_649491 [Neoantrodia serialis]